ncbi:unnamed protein product [Ceutorhynchus assimilis]|uniref:DUF4806 domain-containing protein n=2 Tax=Ceutorhynchus assimilis TaxID=467358 RepID=A0A9N9MX10_9CUCU|nr:unnamed protein product [Ceutorhynchus assimilis]
MWYVVVFTQENTVSVVPASWYVELSGECFWPPSKIKRNTLEKLIKRKELPENDWKTFRAKILTKCEDYKQALSKVHKAYEKDKLSTTDENENVGKGKRKRKPHTYRNFHYSSSEADESGSSDNSLSFPEFGASTPGPSGLSQAQDDNDTSYEEDTSRKQLSIGSRSSQQNRLNATPNLIFRTSQIQNCSERRTDEERSSSGSQLKNFLNRPTRTSEPNDVLPERNLKFHQDNLSVPETQKHGESATVDNSADKILKVLKQMHANSSEFRVQVLRKLKILNLKINELGTSIEKLESGDNINQLDQNLDNEFIDLFPLDIEKLNSLENRLNNEIEMKKMIKYLSRVGGSDVPEIVKRLMYKLLTNEVGNLFSWDGAKGKRKFKCLKLANVILGMPMYTVRANNHTKNATEADIIVYIKKWLVRSKDRMHLEDKRRRRNENQEEEDGNQEEEDGNDTM